MLHSDNFNKWIDILIALIVKQKILQSERKRDKMENIDVKSFSSFAVTLQKLSQPLVQDDSLTATFNPEALNVAEW